MHIKFQSSPMKSGNNSGSCGGLLNYLEKEDKDRQDEHELKGFFDAKRSGLSNDEAKNVIEHDFYKKGLKADADKFFTVTMSFSQDELKGRSNKELIEFAQDKFGSMYCNSVKGREVDPDKLQWVAKLETERTYKGDDDKVKSGHAKSGESKEGDQRHIHFVVARKMNDGRSQISPMSNHFRAGASSGAVKSGFDQDHIKFECEQEFDKRFRNERKEDDKVKSSLGDYRPDLVEKFNSKDIEQKAEKEQAAKEKFSESQKEFEKSMTIWEKVKKTFDKGKDMLFEFGKKIHDKLTNKQQVMSKEEMKDGAKKFLDQEKDKAQKKPTLGKDFIDKKRDDETSRTPDDDLNKSLDLSRDEETKREQEEQSRDHDKDKNQGNDQEMSR